MPSTTDRVKPPTKRQPRRDFVACPWVNCKRVLWHLYYRAPKRSNMKAAPGYGFCPEHGVQSLVPVVGHAPGCTWSNYEKGDVCICGAIL